MFTHASLHGDGISFPFFHLLWSKSSRQRQQQHEEQPLSTDNRAPELRVPDTVLLQLGQPLQWYFTSEKGKKATILRKRKQNLTVDKIEKGFLSRGGPLRDERDAVAYFISKGSDVDEEGAVREGGEKGSANIEYFDRQGLREFLSHGRKERSGILQRFILPPGTQNCLIRAIYTPKLTLLERRRNNQNLFDSRFGLYERTITFEGPDVHSSPAPLRGEVLATKVQSLCNLIVSHVREVTGGRRFGKISRMVVNFKVDEADRVWLLWTSSIRLEGGEGIEPLNIEPLVKLHRAIKLDQVANHDPEKDIQNVMPFLVCPSCGRNEARELFHSVPYKTIIAHFEQVVHLMTTNCGDETTLHWPPDPLVIKAAGGIGFGVINTQDNKDIEEEDVIIPPIIRHLHQRLKVEGFSRYRQDPLFLHKTCQVCENCFLAYAELASNSFQITQPVRVDEGDSKMRSKNLEQEKNDNVSSSRWLPVDDDFKRIEQPVQKSSKRNVVTKSLAGEKRRSIAQIFVNEPELPSAILGMNDSNPIIFKDKSFNENGDDLNSTSGEEIKHDDSATLTNNIMQQEEMFFMEMAPSKIILAATDTPLMHLVTSHVNLEKAAAPTMATKKRLRKKNPYAEKLKFVDVSCEKRTTRKKKEDLKSNPGGKISKGCDQIEESKLAPSNEDGHKDAVEETT